MGKLFQVVSVDDLSTQIPFVATRGGTDLRENAVYVRRQGVTCEANHDELQELINRRLGTGHSTKHEMSLGSHLEDLRLLYSYLPRFSPLVQSLSNQFRAMMAEIPNPEYPAKDFETFIRRMIDIKKRVVENEVKRAGERPGE